MDDQKARELLALLVDYVSEYEKVDPNVPNQTIAETIEDLHESLR